MRTAITIGYDAKGKTTLLAGPEVPADEQREIIADSRLGDLPKGFVRVELWVSDRGLAKKAICPKHNAKLAAEASKAAKEAEEAAKKEAAAAAKKTAAAVKATAETADPITEVFPYSSKSTKPAKPETKSPPADDQKPA